MTLQRMDPDNFRDGNRLVIETERLVLRAPRLADAELLAALANDKRIAENTRRMPHPYTHRDAEDFIAAQNGNEKIFLITRHDGEMIGLCSLAASSIALPSFLGSDNLGPGHLGSGIASDGNVAPEIGYWLGVAHWNRGYATEAVRALIDYAFSEGGHDAVQAGARVSNPASRRILEKCDFQWTGVELCRIHALASSAPIDRFRLDRELWLSLRNGQRIKHSA